MLAELVDHVIGVDPDRDWITLAVLDARSAGVVAEGRFPATKDGYDKRSRSLMATVSTANGRGSSRAQPATGEVSPLRSNGMANGSSSSIDRPARPKMARSPTPWTPCAPPVRCSAANDSRSRELTTACAKRSVFTP